MKVRELRRILFQLDDQNAVIDMSIDEEGNGFGDISSVLAEGKLKDGTPVYSLYPENNEMPESRYQVI